LGDDVTLGYTQLEGSVEQQINLFALCNTQLIVLVIIPVAVGVVIQLVQGIFSDSNL